MLIFQVLGRTLRLFAEEFVSLLLIGLIGGLLMMLIVTIPFVLGGHATTADDLLRGRPVGMRRWFRGAVDLLLPAYLWGILISAGIITFYVAWAFYGQVEGVGILLQAVVFIVAFIWFGTSLYALPLLRRRADDEGWLTVYQRALIMLATRPLDLLFAGLFLVTLAAPAYLLFPSLLIFIPLITIILVSVLVHLHPLMPEQAGYLKKTE